MRRERRWQRCFENCRFEQTVTGNPAWNSVALAVSSGGVTTVKSGVYSGSVAAAYVYNSGGTFNLLGGEYSGGGGTVLKADASTTSTNSLINVYGGVYSGAYNVAASKADLEIKGGVFDADPSNHLAEGYATSSTEGGKYSVGAESAVAKVGETSFASVNDAMNVAFDGAEVTLLSSTNEDVVVPNGRSATLDLNGHTLTNDKSDTITVKNGASLSIIGNGVVDNKTNGRAAIYNSGVVDLKGGTYDRTSETGESADISGGNSWYTICNHGEMTIGEDVEVKNTGSFSSMIENGYYNYGKDDERSGYVEGVNLPNPKLTIDGGHFVGGLNSVKNDDGGILTINGGHFSNTTQSAVLNWNVASISGGTFEVQAEGQSCILNGAFSAASSEQDRGELEITGGVFKTVGDVCLLNNITDVSPVVTGGSFSSDPTAFVPSAEYDVAKNADGMWVVSKKQSGGGTVVVPPTEGEVTENPDGSTTTTVTEEDGSSTLTTVSEDGSVTTVVEKDKDGNVASVEATVEGDEAPEATVALPMEPIAAASSEEAPEISVKAPAGTKVSVPVAKAEGAEDPAPGCVLVMVGADGSETAMSKTGLSESGLALEVPGDCTLKVVDASAGFPDVSEDDWFAGVADFASARNILTGVVLPDGTAEFQGDLGTTRAMFVTMLNRLEMEPEPSEGAPSFSDVDASDWFSGTASWAAEEGLLSGYGDGTFGGGDAVTREQVAVFLMRYAEWLGLDTSARAESAAPDASEVSDWAAEAVSWAVAEGYVLGDEGTGAVRPADGASRAEAAAVVMRFVNSLY